MFWHQKIVTYFLAKYISFVQNTFFFIAQILKYMIP